MSIDLSSRNYLQGMEWAAKPRNKIDTVTARPVNTDTTSAVVHTHVLTTGKTPAGVELTLPMADSDSTYSVFKSMYNMRSSGSWTSMMGTAKVFLTTIKGSYTVTLESPPASTPRASWSLEGKTQYLTRGQKTVEEINNNCDYYKEYCKYVADNAAGTEELRDNRSYDTTQRGTLKDGLLMDYSQGSIPLYPWLRQITGDLPAGLTEAEYLVSSYRPKAEDVFCEWNNQSQAKAWAPQYASWNTYGVTDKIRQGPYTYTPESMQPNSIAERSIPLVPSWKYSFYCNVIKINDVTFQVDYELPVRYFQAAAARAVGPVVHTDEWDRDSYAFKDVVSQITITLTADTFNSSDSEISYSLDGAGKLTTNVLNDYPLIFARNEFITLNTKWNEEPWITAMPEYLLTKYKNGKYIVRCTVTAKWALVNNIHINTQLKVRQQDGTYITRGGVPVTFEVKNIEKVFRADTFTYDLKLLEV